MIRTMRCSLIIALLATVELGLLTNLAVGQARQNRPAAFTDPATAGLDYLLQGEYAGWIYMPGRGNEYTGLQVVALGDGKFDAVRYRGGLPGNGWDRATKAKLSGQAENGRLVLSGSGEQLLVGNFVAIASDNSGHELGRLVKMQRTSPTMGQTPPVGATVLFDGHSNDQFQPGAKVTPDGLLMPGVVRKRRCRRSTCILSSARRSCRPPATRPAATAASISSGGTKCRFSIPSAWKELSMKPGHFIARRHRT